MLRLLAQIITVCDRAKRPVTLCGEIAGDVHFTAMLIALGLTEFSMHPGLMLEVRETVNAIDSGAMRKLAPVLLRASGRESIRKVVEQMRAESRPIVENTGLLPTPA